MLNSKTVCIAMSCDEWFPYIDIRQIEDGLDASHWEVVAEMDYETFIKYKGLLLQMEKLQGILNMIHEEHRKTQPRKL